MGNVIILNLSDAGLLQFINCSWCICYNTSSQLLFCCSLQLGSYSKHCYYTVIVNNDRIEVLKVNFNKNINLPQVLRSVRVRFFFVEESCSSGTIQSHTAKEQEHGDSYNIPNGCILTHFSGSLSDKEV